MNWLLKYKEKYDESAYNSFKNGPKNNHSLSNLKFIFFIFSFLIQIRIILSSNEIIIKLTATESQQQILGSRFNSQPSSISSTETTITNDSTDFRIIHLNPSNGIYSIKLEFTEKIESL